MAECQRCGSHVSEDFERVFGDNNDEVHGCPDCRRQIDMFEGAGANPDFDPRVENENQRKGGSRDRVSDNA